MTRNPSISDSVKSASSRASELSILSDEECKRILSVIERDFELRQKEHNRLQELQKLKRAEADRAEYLANSKEFNAEHCIRCFKAFQFLINPKETCTICGLYVCHACASQVPPKKTWACNACIKLKELEALTSTWFYTQTGSKHKRCGSAKVIRELHKREREFGEFN